MPCYVLDASTLVNLLSGWDDLSELQCLGGNWHIGSKALHEVGFVQVLDDEGKVQRKSVAADEIIRAGGLRLIQSETPKESASFVEFAAQMDDGEAQALALALHRGCILVTDDRIALRVAAELPTPVQTIGTPELLLVWSRTSVHCEKRLAQVVKRVSTLGPFRLKKNSPHYAWWEAALSEVVP